MKKVADALRDSELNLNPTIDGSNLEVIIPKPSQEVRESTVRAMQKQAEKVKKCPFDLEMIKIVNFI